jgi:hypothetical protein
MCELKLGAFFFAADAFASASPYVACAATSTSFSCAFGESGYHSRGFRMSGCKCMSSLFMSLSRSLYRCELTICLVPLSLYVIGVIEAPSLLMPPFSVPLGSPRQALLCFPLFGSCLTNIAKISGVSEVGSRCWLPLELEASETELSLILSFYCPDSWPSP